MNKRSLFFIFPLLCLLACNSDEATDNSEGAFFPVLSYLKAQVAHIDSSVYTITKVTKSPDGNDTVYVKREDFDNVARDFISLPDIASNKLKDKYDESRLYDESLERVVITYTPKDPDVEVRRQDVIIQPSSGTSDNVETIYIEKVANSDDSTVHKKMTWQVAKGFQIRSIIQKKNSPEKIETVEVAWTNYPSAE